MSEHTLENATNTTNTVNPINTSKLVLSSPKISISADMYTSIGQAMIQRYYSENYIFPIEEVPVDRDKTPQFIKTIASKYDVNKYSFERVNSDTMIFLEEKSGKFIVELVEQQGSAASSVSVYCDNIKTGEEIYNLLSEFTTQVSPSSVKFCLYTLNNSGQLETSVITKNIDDFKGLSKKYYPFLDSDEMFKQYLISEDNLLLLAGETGTGKTKIVDLMLQYALLHPSVIDISEDDDDISIYVAYIKNTSILSLDSLWSSLSKNKFHFVVLDDMDHMLIDRNISTNSPQADSDRVKFISNFLSYTDGIFKNKTKFVVTTNQAIDNIDDAILRKGRCFDLLSFRKLTKEEAKDIWVEAGLKHKLELFEKTFEKHKEVTPSELGAKIDFIKASELKDFNSETSYIKEEGISLYTKKINKKIKI